MILSELRNAKYTYHKLDTYDMRARQELVRKIWIHTKEDNVKTEKDGIEVLSKMLGEPRDYLFSQLGEIESFKKERNKARRGRKNHEKKINSSEAAAIAMEAASGKLLGYSGGKRTNGGNGSIKSAASAQAWTAARGQ